MRTLLGVALSLAVSFALSSTASATMRRLAIIVGSNAGAGNQAPLEYAELDAIKLADTITELGGVRSEDLTLLAGRDVVSLRVAIERARADVATWRAQPGHEVTLLFYFSGHSDGRDLEMGGARLPFAELRRLLAATGADIRLTIIDACHSGTILSLKGGSLGPGFEIGPGEPLSASGEALLTSSAAGEDAVESSHIRGSVFTHFLVSGLRGAADASGDGQITLAEAYAYAFDRTRAMTAETILGPQTPGYAFRLTGQGEVVVTSVARPSGGLALPSGFDRVIVIDAHRDRIVGEVSGSGVRRLAVSPGDYRVLARRGERAFAGRAAVREGEVHTVAASELVGMATPWSAIKGDRSALDVALDVPERPRFEFSAAGGARTPIAGALGSVEGLRLEIASPLSSGAFASLEVEGARTDGFAEATLLGFAGYRLGLDRGPLRLQLGVACVFGAIVQPIDGHDTRSTIALGGAVTGRITVAVSRRMALLVEGDVPLLFIRRQAENAGVAMPAGWIGLAFTP